MTDERLAELKKLCDAATPGPWHVNHRNPDPAELFHHKDYRPRDRFHSLYPLSWAGRNLADTITDDWYFIAAARTALPELLAEVERLQGMNAFLSEAVQKNQEFVRSSINANLDNTRLRTQLASAKAVIEYICRDEPKDGGNGACTFCDMGGAGYSSKGDGHHDDTRDVCPVFKASIWLKENP